MPPPTTSPPDPVEHPILKANLKTTKSDAAFNGTTLSGNLTEALIVMGGMPVPALDGAAGDALTEAFAAHRDTFRYNLESGLEPLFVLHELNGAGKKTVRAEFRDAKEESSTSSDPSRSRSSASSR
ncbi:MAG TPA: hypothetical protein VF618_25470 [Thermoanaerobaculia bacterium]